MSNIVISPESGILEFNNNSPSGAAIRSATAPIRLDATGGNSFVTGANFGIGTSSPNSDLHVYAAAGAPTFRITRGDGGQVWVQSIDSSARFQLSEAASEGGTQNLRFQIDDAGETLLAPNGGDVGIGANPPTANGYKTTLHINNDTNGAAIRLSQASNSSLIRYDDTNGLQVGTIASKNLSFETADTTAITIDTSQKVGIGTDNPQADFQVSGSGVFGVIEANAVNSTVTVAGYDDFGLDFRAHNTWTHWKARVGHGINFQLFNDGTTNQNQVLELGKTTKDNAKVYVRSTGAFIEAGMNASTTIPVVSMGCLADSDHLGGAFLDVRDAVTSTHRYEFNRDGTFLASGIKIASKLTHDGDTDTFLEFTDNTITLDAGGEEHIKLEAGGVTINEGGQPNDFRIEGDTDTFLFFVDGSADKIGIGTDSPDFRLEVVADDSAGVMAVRNAANGRDTFRSENAAGTRTVNIGNDANAHGLVLVRGAGGTITSQIAGNGDTFFDTDTLYIDHSTNRVGMGTDSPISPLQIENSVNALADTDEPENYHLFLRNPANDTNEGVGIAFGMSSSTNDVGAGIIFKRTDSSSKGELQFHNKQNATDDGAVTLAMVIKDDGNVGIGTASPLATLDVRGDISGSGSFLGTGVGNRITNNHVPYLLSGDAGTESDTLQTVTDRGSTTTTSISIGDDLAVDTDTLFVDASTDRVGINRSSLTTYDLEVRNGAGGGSNLGVIGGSSTSLVLNTTDTSIVTMPSAQMFLRATGGFFFQSGTTTRAVLTKEGDFGIGVASPSDKFHVEEDGGTVTIGSPTTSYGGIGFEDTALTAANSALFGLASSTILGVKAGGAIEMKIANNSSNGLLKMEDDKLHYTNGNFGIGTSSPDGILNTSGDHVLFQGLNKGYVRVRTHRASTSDYDGVSSSILTLNNYFATQEYGLFATNNNNFRIQRSGNDGYLELDANDFNLSGIRLVFDIVNQAPTNLAINLRDENADEVGFYSPATNVIGFVTDRTERMRIDSAGNVGITTGAASPSAIGSKTTLHIDDSNGAGIRLSDDSADAVIKHDDTTGLVIQTEDAVPLSLGTEGTTVLTISDDQNVGIGTPAPSEKLEISGGNIFLTGRKAGDDGPQIKLAGPFCTWEIENQYVNGATNDMFRIRNAALGSDALVIHRGDNNVGIGTSDPSGLVHIYGGNSTQTISNINGGLVIENNGSADHHYAFQTATAGGGKSFSITNAGNVGIGTTSPSQKLHVQTSDDLIALFESTDNHAQIEIKDNTDSVYISHDAGADIMQLGFNSSTTSNENVTIATDGKVGIGSTTPSEALDVNGAIKGGVNVSDKSADFTLSSADNGNFINGTSTSFDQISISSDLGANFNCTVIHPTKDVDIVGSSSMIINGTTNGTVTLASGYQPASIVRIASNSYAVFGNLL